jgi:uncharacterized protein (TIRG00374 family)
VAERPNTTSSALAAVAGCSLALGLVLWLLVRTAGPMPDADFSTRIFAGLRAVGSQLASLSTAYLLPLLLCEIVVQLSKALKWTAILRTVHPVRYSSALRGVVIGAAATHLVPLRLDEVLRAGVVARRENISPATVFGTVVVDRIVEVFVLGSVLLGLSLLTGGLPEVFQRAAWLLGAGFALAVIGCAVLLRWQERLRGGLPASRLGARIGTALAALNLGLRSLPRGRNLGLLLLGALGEWTATVLFYLLLLNMAGLSTPPALSVLLALGNTVSYALPNLPGAIGIFELIQGGMLEAVGHLNPARATALALSAHALLMLPVTLTGLVLGFFEWRRKKSTDGC